MEHERPNYLVIFLTLALIAMYGYYSHTAEKEREVIKNQSQIISDQQRLIRLYDMYFLTISNSQNQQFLYPQDNDSSPINRKIQL